MSRGDPTTEEECYYKEYDDELYVEYCSDFIYVRVAYDEPECWECPGCDTTIVRPKNVARLVKDLVEWLERVREREQG